MVLDCPIYKSRIKIMESKIQWDGVRGIFEILDVALIRK
jgi:diphthine-ammonia ligase